MNCWEGVNKSRQLGKVRTDPLHKVKDEGVLFSKIVPMHDALMVKNAVAEIPHPVEIPLDALAIMQGLWQVWKGLLDPARQERLLSSPSFLPDGRILFSLTSEAGGRRIEALSLDGKNRTVVLENANTPVYSPTGHLIFGRDGALMATAFDPVPLKIVGAATMLMPKGELGVTNSGALQVSLAANGDLAFIRYGDRATSVDLVDRGGSVQYLPFPRAGYMNPRVSPDGRRIMVEVSGLRAEAVDLERLSMARLTPEVPGMGWPIWNLDGTAVFFRRYNLPHWIATDGTGDDPGPDPQRTTRPGYCHRARPDRRQRGIVS